MTEKTETDLSTDLRLALALQKADRDYLKRIKDINADLLAALEALDKHYRSKITVHDTMLPDDHPLKLSAAAQAKAKGIKE